MNFVKSHFWERHFGKIIVQRVSNLKEQQSGEFFLNKNQNRNQQY